MRRLGHPQTPDADHGGVAILVAVLLLALFGAGALVVDVGYMFWERRQLQNGADAAALALAAQCAEGILDCATAALGSEAEGYADRNAHDSQSAVPGFMRHGTDSDDCEPSGDNAANPLYLPGVDAVKVSTETWDGGDSSLTHWLAPVLGFDSATVSACAVASWGNIGSGPDIVPLTFSMCEWDDMTNGLGADGLPTSSKTVVFHTGTDPDTCAGPAGQDVPGGFGWTGLDGSGTCSAAVPSDQWVERANGTGGGGSPSPANSTGCTDQFFQDEVADQTILMPVFSEVCHNGSQYPDCPSSLPNKTHYYIDGFAALEVEGYRFGGNDPVYNPPCNNPERCIRGRFVEYYDYGTQPSDSAPDFGAVGISLTD